MQARLKINIVFCSAILCIGASSCSKLIRVPDPVTSITTAETFASDGTATSAILGIYNDIASGNGGGGYSLAYGNGLLTIDAGMSADELHIFNGPSPFETNTLTVSNFDISLWNYPYFDIYLSNASIEALAIANGVTPSTRDQLTGEAKFLRAFCYFYLVNLFGDVPLALTAAYAKTDTLSRTPSDLVYQQIVSDLQDASRLLTKDYSISNGERVRVNQSGALALLARVYLYQGKWQEADSAATAVIGNSLYKLDSNLNQVFLANNNEAILQWQQQANFYPYATAEGNKIIPSSPTDPPRYYLTDQLLGAFEPGDNRKNAWIDSTVYLGTTYYYPYKYKVSVGSQSNATEYCTVLRLAEQYLIRAEARARQNNSGGAISDLNIIRERAALPDLPGSLTPTQILSAIDQERRIELFSEFGHRWLDLKRTGEADSVLSLIKPGWQPYKKLFPISLDEINNDPQLTQTPGY